MIDQFEIEPDTEPASRPVTFDAIVVPIVPEYDQQPALPMLQALPPEFRVPVEQLLQFLPDVKIKQRIVATAEEALRIDVASTTGGLQQADEALASLRALLKQVDECFEFPVSTANQLHKRLTGLRADFRAAGEAALKTVGERIYAETKRRERILEDRRREAQAQADAEARATAKQALDAALAQPVAPPSSLVDALERQATAGTAPPVGTLVGVPALRNTSTVENWKARPKGTEPGAEPNPATVEMTEAQRGNFLLLLDAIVKGKAPLALVEPNYSAINARAKAEKNTLTIPGFEPYDAGSTRAKSRR